MSNKCLVTKLKAVVNNPNLPVFGKEILEFSLIKNIQMSCYSVEESTLKIIGEGNFLTAIDGTSIGKTVNIGGGNTRDIFISSDTTKIEFSKYLITDLSFAYGSAVSLISNLNEIFEYSSNLERINVQGVNQISVDFINFNQFLNKEKYPNLTSIVTNGFMNSGSKLYLNLNDIDESLLQDRIQTLNFTGGYSPWPNLFGNINKLKFGTLLTPCTFYFRESNFEGELSTLLDYYVTKVTNPVVVTVMGNGTITLNGSVLSNTAQTIDVTSSGWTVR